MIYNLPRAKKKGETWYLNEYVLGEKNKVYSFIFTSNNTDFIGLRTGSTYPVNSNGNLVSARYLDYLKQTSREATLISVNTDTGWKDEAYRTITLSEPATGDLLTWLQSNAIKQ